MLTLLYFKEGSSLISFYVKEFNFTGPSPDHDDIFSWANVVMLNLIGVKGVKFISLHWPYIKCGISLATCSNNKLFIFRYVDSWGIAFKYIAEEPFDLLEVDSFFAYELVVDDGLVEA